MNTRKLWSGCGTALVTPFHQQELDQEALRKLVHRQLDAGIHFLVPLGTTAETPCLTWDEKLRILEIVRQEAPSTPLLVGAGTNATATTRENLLRLRNSPADGFLLVTPYYNKPTQEGLWEHFRILSESTEKPIVLYNVPGRTGVNLLPETTLRLAELPNIAGIKEASGNYAQICEIIRHAPEDFSVLSGNDDETFSLMCSGADGVISVASNLVPQLMSKLCELLMNHQVEAARKLHLRLLPLFKHCFLESNPIPVKAALAQLGWIHNELRLPLTPATANTQQILLSTLSHLQDLS